MAAPLSAPPFLKVQFFKNMNAYASVPKNGLFMHKFFFFVRSNELKHQKKWDFMAWFESFVHPKSWSGCNKSRFNRKQYTVESDLNEIWHWFYIPMRSRASYFHTLLIIEKGEGKGCAHNTCKVLMGSKMWEKDTKFYFPFWTHKHLACIVYAPLSAPLLWNKNNSMKYVKSFL